MIQFKDILDIRELHLLTYFSSLALIDVDPLKYGLVLSPISENKIICIHIYMDTYHNNIG